MQQENKWLVSIPLMNIYTVFITFVIWYKIKWDMFKSSKRYSSSQTVWCVLRITLEHALLYIGNKILIVINILLHSTMKWLSGRNFQKITTKNMYKGKVHMEISGYALMCWNEVTCANLSLDLLWFRTCVMMLNKKEYSNTIYMYVNSFMRYSIQVRLSIIQPLFAFEDTVM